MNTFQLLIVEDESEALESCRDTVARYIDEKQRKVELTECKTADEAFEKLDNSFDGAIIDLKLADQADAGNDVVKRIEKLRLRIPIAILTGTPGAADSDLNFNYIGVFSKGESGARYNDLLDRFWEIHDTGLTRIMGGRGIIEETLNKVFRENLLRQKDTWVKYGKNDPSRTEKALLRHALGHLFQLIDEDGDRCFPEEVYLAPPFTDKIQTGSVVEDEYSKQRFVIMSPACDLVIRDNGKRNTDRILIVEIDSEADLFSDHPANALSKKQIKDRKKAYTNNRTAYYHWLPKAGLFEGGFLNFRKLSSLSIEDFKKKFRAA